MMIPPKYVSRSGSLQEEYPQVAAKWLAMLQIVFGLSALLLFIVAVVVCRVLGVLNIAVAICFVVSGIFNLISARRLSRSILVAVTTAAIISATAAALYLHAASYGYLVRFHGLPILHMIITWEILQGVLMFICLVEGILSIIFLVMASRSLCNCCQTQIFIIQPNSSTPALRNGLSTIPFTNHRMPSSSSSNTSSNNDDNSVYFNEYHPPPPDYKEVI